MSEMKCPCCGSEASDFEQTGIIECEECQFMCDIKDFQRISAAMELAEARAWKKEVWGATRKPWDFVSELRKRRSSIEDILGSLDFAYECVKKAERRVDEVFGGE